MRFTSNQFTARLLIGVLCIVIPVSAFAAEDLAYKVAYDGGSIPGVKAGVGLKLYIAPPTLRSCGKKRT